MECCGRRFPSARTRSWKVAGMHLVIVISSLTRKCHWQQFVEINATGFRKILKKWDKRSTSSTKELYLARQVDIQPVFNRQVRCKTYHPIRCSGVVTYSSLLNFRTQLLYASKISPICPRGSNSRDAPPMIYLFSR